MSLFGTLLPGGRASEAYERHSTRAVTVPEPPIQLLGTRSVLKEMALGVKEALCGGAGPQSPSR